jgi:protein phosphatase
VKLSYAERSIAGPCASNQDSVGFWRDVGGERGAIALLADGVGSLGSGDIASQLAVRDGLRVFRAARPDATLRQRLLELFNTANQDVFDKGFEPDGPGRIATTLAAAAFGEREVVVGNVGDSRVYLVHRGMIKQLSVDHSLVGMQRRFGHITEAESRTSEFRHLITRGLGVEPQVRLDMDEAPLFAGDQVVLCSDGLHGYVSDLELARIVGKLDPKDACRELVALAEKRNTTDNTSVQVIAIESV